MKKKILVLFIIFFTTFAVQAQYFIIHRVKDGETLRDIAKHYQMSTLDILKYNGEVKDGIKLVPGQSILIPNKRTIEVNNKPVKLTEKIIDYKYHTVDKNETLFSLSKKYHSKIESIVKLNKIEGTDIKLGQILIIPIFEDENALEKIDESKYTYYEVQPHEGKWRVSYNRGITIDELERLNPEIVNETIKVGQKLVVPKLFTSNDKVGGKSHFFYYKVLPDETLYSLSKRFSVSQAEIIRLNPVLSDGLKAGQMIKLPKNNTHGLKSGVEVLIKDIKNDNKVEPFNSKENSLKTDGLNTSNLLENLRTDKVYRIAIILPFKLKAINNVNEEKCNRISDNSILDYYSGIELAIDSLSSLGLNIKYDVIDTQGSILVTKKIVKTINLSNYNFVIGPIKKENIEYVAKALEIDNTPVVVHNYKGNKKFKNLVITTTNNSELEQHMVQYLREKSKGKQLTIICDPANSVKVNTVAKRLGTNVRIVKGRKTKKGNSIAATTILNKLKGKENYVLLMSKDESFIFSVLSTLNSVADTKKITLFTLQDYKLYEDDTNDRMNTFLSNLHYHFPAKVVRLFNKDVLANYKHKFGIPPSFAAINGFDTTFDVLVRAANADNLFEGLQKIGRTTQSSKVYLYKYNTENGFKNQGSNLLRINKQLQLIKVE